ncbi:MAG: type II secretion system ATPase GspE [Bdellovibrionaceae bacterium]|nr:type II secretion system ATPase GspE [Pseudobdellovibrionaceae bacterium]
MAATDITNILAKATSLNMEQVKTLLAHPTANGGMTLGEALGGREHANVDELISDLCREMSLEFMKDIPVNDIPVDLVRDIPINYAKQHSVLPFREEQDQIIVLTANPLNYRSLDDLRVMYGKKIKPVISPQVKIQDAINRVYEKSTSNLAGLDEIEAEDYDLDDPIVDLLEAGDDDAPVIKLVNSLLFRAVKEKASDIHVEPYEKDMAVRFRIDGVMFDIFKPPKKLQNSITSRLKVMATMNIAEKRLPQDGRIPLKVGGKDIDIRVNSVPTAFGERIVMRLQDRSNVVLELEQLGFAEDMLKGMYDLIGRSYGILLVTGPTGSGKSTTLYASLSKINSPDQNILTIEDPVEQRIHGIGQVQVNSKIGLTFASGLRAFLRQDPDVIMVGEIRDQETAELAIQASLTGHLVLSTIHTNDSAGAFPRLMDIGAEPFLIATSIMGVVAQRLVRILCPHCKLRYEPSAFELSTLGIAPEVAKNANICRPIGCDKCNQKGYIGRTNIAELLIVDDEIRSMIMQRKDGASIRKVSIAKGMKTFRDHGIQKVLTGTVSIEELMTNTQLDL